LSDFFGGNMVGISAQVSLYPLGLDDLSPTIDEVLWILREYGLDVNPGLMSSLIAGDDKTVFTALQAAFRHVASQGQVVMVVTFSNACPLPTVQSGSQDYLPKESIDKDQQDVREDKNHER
jgi:uncharacterized protein YqgV (UPF0045/DUF77 family)